MANEKRLIWGDIAEEHLLKLAEHYKGSFSGDAFERAAQEIHIMPTVDAVEVVRCKDCKHMEITPYKLRWCNVWEGINGMGDDGYCNYGERKDNE